MSNNYRLFLIIDYKYFLKIFESFLDFCVKNPTLIVCLFYIILLFMRTVFKVLKGFFYFLTIVVWVVYLRGEVLFDQNVFMTVKSLLIPWYLVFCGLMLWYLVATFWVWREKYVEDINKERIATRSLIVWVVSWIIFNVLYLFS